MAPDAEHWIVVDRADLALFRSLEDRRTTLVTTEDVFPVWARRLDLRKVGLRSNVWLQARGRPIRGWLIQQLVKLALSTQLTADVIVHADSDVVLLRPFSSSQVIDGQGRVRLYAQPGGVDERLPNHVRWHRSAEKVLGLAHAQLPLPDFITSLVPWSRANVQALLEHVERHTGRHWARALAAAWDISEYTLYGRFATDVLGPTNGQHPTSASLCRDYWTPSPLARRELESFLDALGRDEIGVSITAKAGMDPAGYGEIVASRWSDPG